MFEKSGFNVMVFGLASGILFGVCMFLFGLIAGASDWGVQVVQLVGDVYVGYNTTFAGSLVGGVWGFFDGFIGGALFAWLYNWLLKVMKK